jgi:hypothetical protein
VRRVHGLGDQIVIKVQSRPHAYDRTHPICICEASDLRWSGRLGSSPIRTPSLPTCVSSVLSLVKQLAFPWHGRCIYADHAPYLRPRNHSPPRT